MQNFHSSTDCWLQAICQLSAGGASSKLFNVEQSTSRISQKFQSTIPNFHTHVHRIRTIFFFYDVGMTKEKNRNRPAQSNYSKDTIYVNEDFIVIYRRLLFLWPSMMQNEDSNKYLESI